MKRPVDMPPNSGASCCGVIALCMFHLNLVSVPLGGYLSESDVVRSAVLYGLSALLALVAVRNAGPVGRALGVTTLTLVTLLIGVLVWGRLAM